MDMTVDSVCEDARQGAKSVLAGILAGLGAYLVTAFFWAFVMTPYANQGSLLLAVLDGFWALWPWWLVGSIVEEVFKLWCAFAFAFVFFNKKGLRQTAFVTALIFALVELIAYTQTIPPSYWTPSIWLLRAAVVPAVHVVATQLMVSAVLAEGWKRKSMWAIAGLGVHVVYNMVAIGSACWM